jgi:hypothetical protein
MLAMLAHSMNMMTSILYVCWCPALCNSKVDQIRLLFAFPLLYSDVRLDPAMMLKYVCAENIRETGTLDSRPFVAQAICPSSIEYVGKLLGVFHTGNDLTREVG